MELKTRSHSMRARESQHALTSKPGGAFTVLVEKNDGSITKYDNIHKLDRYVAACYKGANVRKVYIECVRP